MHSRARRLALPSLLSAATASQPASLFTAAQLPPALASSRPLQRLDQRLIGAHMAPVPAATAAQRRSAAAAVQPAAGCPQGRLHRGTVGVGGKQTLVSIECVDATHNIGKQALRSQSTDRPVRSPRTCGKASEHAARIGCKVERAAVLAVGQPGCNGVQVHHRGTLRQGRKEGGRTLVRAGSRKQEAA